MGLGLGLGLGRRGASSARAQRLLLHSASIESALSAPALRSESWHSSARPPSPLHARLTSPSREREHSSSRGAVAALCSRAHCMCSHAKRLSPARAVHLVALQVRGTVGQPELRRASIESGQDGAVPCTPPLASHVACSKRQPTWSVPTSGSAQVVESCRSKAPGKG